MLGCVCSLLTMDGGRFKGCTEGDTFRLVISTKRNCIINENSLGVVCMSQVVLELLCSFPWLSALLLTLNAAQL